MAACSCRVAVLVLLFSLAVMLVATPPPCAAAARVLLLVADVRPRAGTAGGEHGSSKGDGPSLPTAADESRLRRGSPPASLAGRRTTAAGNAAARVLGSVPSPGVGH
ncbi:unnamed protein product [Miscanthus lutarioriparius]|uniref:Uncharacterized protein n=1 Tax=Miscanthus lutarioriparius TaxID=422564 RepID=A0A811SDC6_9POAL|nr:unnamed protein product [Miscanthus lutarioriparius]